MIERSYEILLNELIQYRNRTHNYSRDKVADSFWNRENNYDELVCEYIRNNISTLKLKDSSIDMLKLYDDLIVNNIIVVRIGLVHPYNIFRLVWKYFSHYIPDKDSYNKMYNNALLAYRLFKWFDNRRKKRRSYVRIKSLLFDILDEDYNMMASVIGSRLDIPAPLVKRILLDDLRKLI